MLVPHLYPSSQPGPLNTTTIHSNSNSRIKYAIIHPIILTKQNKQALLLSSLSLSPSLSSLPSSRSLPLSPYNTAKHFHHPTHQPYPIQTPQKNPPPPPPPDQNPTIHTEQNRTERKGKRRNK
ncbi:hypothetical protein L873DRAFT_1481 [Choiromyces venosus 120613-1]|uniref:Uncharacterized protein n=1 Tax=Choiromyces venosus 120613-1 TaxID=1336337 RepID=A0A3N4K5R8_9PEZI|nr:hypothetical protein L873DRAFT_1481 [Choiromyces venosus 120613-1]